MSVSRKGSSAQTPVQQSDVKLCALCGTLNHKKNVECYTCGWHGEFKNDEHTISLAWQRLYDQFETVQLCHVSGGCSFTVGEFGAPVQKKAFQGWLERTKAWWASVLAKSRQRAIHPDPRMRAHGFPHNELGV